MIQWLWSEGDDARSDAERSTAGNSSAVLHFSQLGAEYSGSIETRLTQSDKSIKGGGGS